MRNLAEPFAALARPRRLGAVAVFFVVLVAAPADAAPQGRVSAVTAGWAHTCALRVDDRVACWGRGTRACPCVCRASRA